MNEGELYTIRWSETPQVVVHGVAYQEVRGPFNSEQDAIDDCTKQGLSTWVIVKQVSIQQIMLTI